MVGRLPSGAREHAVAVRGKSPHRRLRLFIRLSRVAEDARIALQVWRPTLARLSSTRSYLERSIRDDQYVNRALAEWAAHRGCLIAEIDEARRSLCSRCSGKRRRRLVGCAPQPWSRRAQGVAWAIPLRAQAWRASYPRARRHGMGHRGMNGQHGVGHKVDQVHGIMNMPPRAHKQKTCVDTIMTGAMAA